MYKMIPEPHAKAIIAVINLITVGSMLRYSAIPPHTPHIFLFLDDLYNLFSKGNAQKCGVPGKYQRKETNQNARPPRQTEIAIKHL